MKAPYDAVDTVPSDFDENERSKLPEAVIVGPQNNAEPSTFQLSRRYQREATEEVEVSPLYQKPLGLQQENSFAFEDSSGDVMAEITSESLNNCFQVDTITRSSFEPESSIDEDDDASQYSTYYDFRDFNPSTWTEVVYNNMEYTSMAGIALVATAAVIVHPLVLIAGAATAVWAVGSVHAAQYGYEFFSDGSFSRLFWSDPPSAETYEERLLCAKEQAERFETESLTSETKESQKSESTASTVISEDEGLDKKDSLLHVISEVTSAPCDDDALAANQQWALQNFPALEKEVVRKVEFLGLNAHEFFHVFFSDDAPYSFMEFQKKRGDTDISYGAWERVSPNPLSMHPDGERMKQSDEHGLVCHERRLTFKTLTKSYFGPAYASTIKTQRVFLSKRLMVLESCTKLSNIPFSDRFQVMERWILTSQKRNEMAECKLAWLSVHTEAQFSRGCAFEHQIRTKSFSTLKEIVTSWCDMARQALKLTEQNKREREKQGTCSSGEDIDHIGSTTCEQEEDLLAQHESNFKQMEQEVSAGAALGGIEVKYSRAAGRSHSYARVLEDAEYQSDHAGNKDKSATQVPDRAQSFSAFGRNMLDRRKRRQSMQ